MDDDPLHALGMYLINMDRRYAVIGTVCFFVAAYFIAAIVAHLSKVERDIWKVSGKNAVAGLLSMVSLLSAVKIGSVFLLTKPPAFDQLKDNDIDQVGVVSFAILFALSILGIYEFCRRGEKPKPPRPDPTPGDPQVSQE